MYKGWFNQTLATWHEKNLDNVAFMHIDCDLYSSTVDILEALKDRMQFGTIILFDEYFNYSNWENHEFKAWQEFVVKYQIQYEYIGFDRQQVAVKIMHIGK